MIAAILHHTSRNVMIQLSFAELFKVWWGNVCVCNRLCSHRELQCLQVCQIPSAELMAERMQ